MIRGTMIMSGLPDQRIISHFQSLNLLKEKNENSREVVLERKNLKNYNS